MFILELWHWWLRWVRDQMYEAGASSCIRLSNYLVFTVFFYAFHYYGLCILDICKLATDCQCMSMLLCWCWFIRITGNRTSYALATICLRHSPPCNVIGSHCRTCRIEGQCGVGDVVYSFCEIWDVVNPLVSVVYFKPSIKPYITPYNISANYFKQVKHSFALWNRRMARLFSAGYMYYMILIL